ncbi:MAG: J domain-containing protein [Pelobacteraceae bacterium]
MTYTELQNALQVMGLRERASMKDIKARHRELVKRHHPDTGATSEPEVIRQINAAYRILQDYVTDYRFSFAENEFYEQNPEERFRQQFMDFYDK